MTIVHALRSLADLERGIELAREALNRGEVIAFPVESGYAVACEPFSAEAITAIQKARGAEGNALPLLIGTQQTLDGIAKPLAPEVRTMLTALWPGLLTIVLPAAIPWDLGDGGSGVVAVRQPSDPIALALLRHGPLAATSAARAGRSAHTAEEVIAELGSAVSLVLDDGARLGLGVSTMVTIDAKTVRVQREGAVSRDRLAAFAIGVEFA